MVKTGPRWPTTEGGVHSGASAGVEGVEKLPTHLNYLLYQLLTTSLWKFILVVCVYCACDVTALESMRGAIRAMDKSVETVKGGAKKARTRMSSDVFAVRYLYMPIAIGVFLLSAILGIFGVVLVYLGAKGDTQITLFGQSMSTADVGVASIFICAVMVILVIRALLKSAREGVAKGLDAYKTKDIANFE